MGEQFVIRTGRNGILDGTSPAQAAAVLEQLRSQPRVVVHLHGGLVSESAGLATAARLSAFYQNDAQAYPVFMVWQSGLLEVLRHNLDEILKEDLFQRLLKKVIQFTLGKLWQEEGQRAGDILALPKPNEVSAQLARRDPPPGGQAREPYETESAPVNLADLSSGEVEQLELSVRTDPAIIDAVTEVVNQRHPERIEEGARGVVRVSASHASLIDPEALDEIDPGSGGSGERGIISTAMLAKKAGKVLIRVIRRFREHEDHGVYPTVVEELLREFYLANAGGAVWAAMKKETLDTFAGPGRGGRLLVDALAGAVTDNPNPPSLTLVGHSTGAVYINNLLTEVARGQQEGYRPWPDSAKFQVVLLAPASTYAGFTDMLASAGDLLGELCMFTMSDEAEQADHLGGMFYPRSLLYLVSGMVERDAAGDSAVVPLVGLSRYRTSVYDARSTLARGRSYLTDARVVLSPTGESTAVGRRAGARTHTAFDEDPDVLASIAQLVRRSS